jgi:glycerol-3-phosphate cytidylyltransferase
MRRVLTYGTFDTLHYGHIRLLQRARALGDHLTVGLSTDAFNAGKGKAAHFSWDQRRDDLLALRAVDSVIAEETWEQKAADIAALRIDVFVMGDDWAGRFDDLSALCEVVYLPRTPEISSTMIRGRLRA